jgi:hypothetical protein
MTGARFDSAAVVEALVEETLRCPWGLSFLQFMLAELWEARDPATTTITHEALARLEDGPSALARHADAVLRSLSGDQRAAARRILVQLAGAADSEARCREDEIVAGDPVTRLALHELVRGRLVAVRSTETGVAYELVHAALREAWATLRDWVRAPAGEDVDWPEAQAEEQAERLRREAEALYTSLGGGPAGDAQARDTRPSEEPALAVSGRKATSRREHRRARVARTFARVLRGFASLADVLDPEPGSRARRRP